MESLLLFAAFVIGFGLWQLISPRRREDDGNGDDGNGWGGDGNGNGGNGGD